MFKKTTLDNGLRLITAPQPGNLAVTVLVLVEAGSKYETIKNNGVSHFLEHMCFKGTEKRPTALQITTELDGMGSESNAFTSHEITGYYIKAESRHLEHMLDLLSDMYLNPIFDPKEIDKERGVIIGEIDMINDNPMRSIYDKFTSLLYGDQPAGWNIAGPKENIRKLTREDFIKYRDDNYVASSTTVVVAGAFDEAETVKNISDLFNNISKGEKAKKLKVKEEQSEPKILFDDKQLDQNHVMLGFRAYDIFDERKYALEVLSDILGGGMSSRLFHSVREELGAAYYVKSMADFHTDHGYMAIASGLGKEKLEEAIEAILKDLRKIKEELVPEEELRKSKNSITGRMVLELETSDELASFYGIQEAIETSILTPREVRERIEAVTADDIQKIARDIFTNDKLNMVVMGPVEDKDKIKDIFKIY